MFLSLFPVLGTFHTQRCVHIIWKILMLSLTESLFRKTKLNFTVRRLVAMEGITMENLLSTLGRLLRFFKL